VNSLGVKTGRRVFLDELDGDTSRRVKRSYNLKSIRYGGWRVESGDLLVGLLQKAGVGLYVTR